MNFFDRMGLFFSEVGMTLSSMFDNKKWQKRRQRRRLERRVVQMNGAQASDILPWAAAAAVVVLLCTVCLVFPGVAQAILNVMKNSLLLRILVGFVLFPLTLMSAMFFASLLDVVQHIDEDEYSSFIFETPEDKEEEESFSSRSFRRRDVDEDYYHEEPDEDYFCSEGLEDDEDFSDLFKDFDDSQYDEANEELDGVHDEIHRSVTEEAEGVQQSEADAQDKSKEAAQSEKDEDDLFVSRAARGSYSERFARRPRPEFSVRRPQRTDLYSDVPRFRREGVRGEREDKQQEIQVLVSEREIEGQGRVTLKYTQSYIRRLIYQAIEPFSERMLFNDINVNLLREAIEVEAVGEIGEGVDQIQLVDELYAAVRGQLGAIADSHRVELSVVVQRMR